MPYCPNCLTEYQSGISECFDCHVPLLPGTPVFCPKCGEPTRQEDSFCDHCGILLRDESDEHAPTCDNHPDIRAVGGCIVCGKPLCDECATEIDGKVFCARDSHFEVHQDYAVAYRTSAAYEAEMVRANLESAGFDVKIFDQHGHIYFVDIGELALVNVMVPKTQLDAAKEIIDAITTEEPLSEDEGDGDKA